MPNTGRAEPIEKNQRNTDPVSWELRPRGVRAGGETPCHQVKTER